MITLTIDRVANAGDNTAGGIATFHFSYTGPSLAMIPQSTLAALIGLDEAIAQAIKDNAPGTNNPPDELPEGSVILSAEDVTNLDADLNAKTEAVKSIGKVAPPQEGGGAGQPGA